MEDEFISTGVWEVDQILGGGFLRGRIAEVFGDEGSGKTSLALSTVAGAGVTLWYDLDSTFPWHIAAQKRWERCVCPVIDFNRTKPFDELPELLPAIMRGCDMIVFDPVAALGARNVIDLVELLNPLCRRFDCAAVLVNHCDLQNRSTGHSTISFYAGQRLEVRFVREVENGMETKIRCVKNVAAPPFHGCSRTILFEGEEGDNGTETETE
jgi:recombination protein RecA